MSLPSLHHAIAQSLKSENSWQHSFWDKQFPLLKKFQLYVSFQLMIILLSGSCQWIAGTWPKEASLWVWVTHWAVVRVGPEQS